MATVVVLVAWFAALFTGRVPQGLHGFLAGFLRYQVHVFAYATLAADPFPGFSGLADYPVTVTIDRPVAQGRLTVFFRILLAIPAAFISSALNSLTEVLVFFAWFVCLALGRMPEGMRNLLAFSVRYHAQTQAYETLLTGRYPSLNVGFGSASPRPVPRRWAARACVRCSPRDSSAGAGAGACGRGSCRGRPRAFRLLRPPARDHVHGPRRARAPGHRRRLRLVIGPRRHPSIPLVISPHGRNATPLQNAQRWGDLPAVGQFAVVNPEGQGRKLTLYLWGAPGEIRDRRGCRRS